MRVENCLPDIELQQITSAILGDERLNTKEEEFGLSNFNSLFKHTAFLSLSLTKLRLIGFSNWSEVEVFQNKLTVDLPLYLTIAREENYPFSLEEFIYSIDRFIDYISVLETTNLSLYQQFNNFEVLSVLVKMNWELLLIYNINTDYK